MPVLSVDQQAPRSSRRWALALALALLLLVTGGVIFLQLAARTDGFNVGQWNFALEHAANDGTGAFWLTDDVRPGFTAENIALSPSQTYHVYAYRKGSELWMFVINNDPLSNSRSWLDSSPSQK